MKGGREGGGKRGRKGGSEEGRERSNGGMKGGREEGGREGGKRFVNYLHDVHEHKVLTFHRRVFWLWLHSVSAGRRHLL